MKTVANADGWTRIRADVEEVMIEDDKAVGVRLKGGEEIRAGALWVQPVSCPR